MKLIKSIALFSMLFALFTACKKDSDSPGAVVDGTWVGKFGNDNDDPSVFYSLNFKPGGILEEIDQSGEVRGVGSWNIDNNNIITGHTVNTKSPVGKKYSIVAAFYPGQNVVLGNWGFDDSATNGGTFELTTKK
jgi:hypothetical protein